MRDDSFGVYVKTFRPDYHLAQAFIASLRRWTPGVAITVVPDDEFEGSHFFGERVLRLEDPFLHELRGYFKKLWVFFGHYEKFLYVDADTLTIGDPSALFATIGAAQPPFFMACMETAFASRWASASAQQRRTMCGTMLGDLDLISELDPSWAPAAHEPLPSGVFAANRGCLSLDVLRNVHRRAMEINKRHGKPPLATSREGIFMGDQGLVNYLVRKSGIPVSLLPDVFVWGDQRLWRGGTLQRTISDSPLAGSFVTWAGCPRPTVLCTSVPHGAAWRRAFREFHRARRRPLEMLGSVLRSARLDLSIRIRRLVRSQLSVHL